MEKIELTTKQLGKLYDIVKQFRHDYKFSDSMLKETKEVDIIISNAWENRKD